jgi:hypothetical protein
VKKAGAGDVPKNATRIIRQAFSQLGAMRHIERAARIEIVGTI